MHVADCKDKIARSRMSARVLLVLLLVAWTLWFLLGGLFASFLVAWGLWCLLGAVFSAFLIAILVDAVFLKPPARTGKAIVLFDGVCLLCSHFVHFVIDHDPADRFRFLSLQSESAAALLAKHGIPNDLNTVVLIDEDAAHVRSTAALRVLRYLGAPYRLIFVSIVLPRPIRDAAYRLIASVRYRIFGKDDAACRRMTPAMRARMLETESQLPPKNE